VSPLVPFFVVIITTPFAALEPYSDAAAASFRTVILSISLGLSVASRLPPSYSTPVVSGTPSITYKGELEAEKDPRPLILWVPHP